MLEVFKTDIRKTADAQSKQQQLHKYFPGCRVVFDLEDCDRILKITGRGFLPQKVQELVRQKGFFCEALE